MSVGELLALLKERKIYDLGQPFKRGMPGLEVHPPFVFSLYKSVGDVFAEEGVTAANDILVMGGHVGTHIDAVGHIAKNMTFFGGHPVRENQTGQGGLHTVGIDATPPLVMRGILLDVATYKACDVLEPAYAISRADLEGSLKRQGVGINKGDAVLIRTGWTKYWDNPQRYADLQKGVPGLVEDGAVWLLQCGVAIVGADNLALERFVAPIVRLPVHSMLLAEHGVQIIEMLNLEELAQSRVYEFLLIVLSLKIVGGTASPVRPIAIA